MTKSFLAKQTFERAIDMHLMESANVDLILRECPGFPDASFHLPELR